MKTSITRAARLALIGALIGITLGVAACNTANTAEPTPILTPPRPTVAASATVDPRLPSGDGSGGMAIGASNPTLAGLAAEGQPSLEAPTPTPAATAAWLPMSILTADGLAMQAIYYSAPIRPAPGVLLLHMEGGDRTVWDDLVLRLQAEGYIALAVDLRGHGETGGPVDWTRAQSDINAALVQLGQFPGVAANQIVVVGASVTANLALHACADAPGCAGVIVFSPGLDVHGITAADAMARLGARPVLIIAGENDGNNPGDSIELSRLAQGEHDLRIYGAGHGTDLLDTEPGVIDVMIAWLVTHVPPPSPDPAPAP
jgi:pimeloyl-ACP methyl ester carboxylesterase